MNTPKWARDRRPRSREHDEVLMYFDFMGQDINNVVRDAHYHFEILRADIDLLRRDVNDGNFSSF